MKNRFFNMGKKYLEEIQVTKFYNQMRGAYENYMRSNSNLWANTLCYFTTLSFIPILAIAFSVGKWFGIDKFYLKHLNESSPMSEEVISSILEVAQTLIDSTKSGVIAGVGAISLIWVIISMFSIIEKALNSIWRIKKTRPFFRKFTDYFVTFLTLPLSVIIANLLRTIKTGIEPIDLSIQILTPYLGLWLFFLVFYTVLPNTKVKLVPALWSSFIVSFLLNQSNTLLLRLQSVIAAYNKIYGGFSVLLLSLIWLKIIWFLILIGAHFSYILQNRSNLANLDGIENFNFKSKCILTNIILKKFMENYENNQEALTIKEISKKTNICDTIVDGIVENLKEMKYISSINEDLLEEKQYKLTMNIDLISSEKLKFDLESFGKTYIFKNKIECN